MPRFATANWKTAAVGAVLAAGLIAILDSVFPAAKAEVVSPLPPQPDLAAKATACLLQGWPHYEPRCQFDLRTSDGQIRSVRVIALR
jgi:hypothetical protein